MLSGHKHSRDDDPNERRNISFYDLYSGDIGEIILSYASINDLCTLDAVNKNFQELTKARWKNLSYELAGMKNGKIDVMRYLSFMREPMATELIDDEDHGFGSGFAGTPNVETNGSMVVMVSDDSQGNLWDRTFPSKVNECICVRDAYSLNFCRLVSSPIQAWDVKLCGRIGSEIIIVSNYNRVAAIRGKDSQILHKQVFRDAANSDGIHCLGNETHLVVAFEDQLRLYRVETDTSSKKLLSFKQAIGNGHSFKNDRKQVRISWDSNKTTFACNYGTAISVWNIDPNTDTLIRLTSIDYGEDEHLVIQNIALCDDYIIGASMVRDIHVWDRATGKKLPRVLSDIEDKMEREDLLDVDDIISSLTIWSYGHILISSSYLGNKLCIWNVKCGKLLKQHPLDGLDELPEGNDLSSIAYIEHLNGFVLVSAFLTTFMCLPTNKRQAQMAHSICIREQRIYNALLKHDSLGNIWSEKIMRRMDVEVEEEKDDDDIDDDDDDDDDNDY